MRFRKLGVVILLLSPLATAAQPQQESSSGQPSSLADAARQAQAQKKSQPQSAKVWDNDNIPTTTNNISVVGQASAGDGGPTASTSAVPTQKKGAAAPEQKAAILADLNASKAQLESLKADLDIAQRKYALDQQTYLSNPNYVDKSGGAQALDEEKEQIAAKQQEITEAQKRVDDLQTQLDAANSGASK